MRELQLPPAAARLKALKHIHETQSYLERCLNFENYVESRWKLAAREAYRLIEAARVAQLVRPMGLTSFSNERVARGLVPLKKEPERLCATWKALSTLEKPPLAREVRAVV